MDNKQIRLLVAKEVRRIARNVESMYGRINGMGAIYDSFADSADFIENGKNFKELDDALDLLVAEKTPTK